VVRRRDAAIQRRVRREKLAQAKQRSVLTEFEARITVCCLRLECADRYVTVIETRIARTMDRARDQATKLWLAAQLEEIEISRLAAPQIERAHTRADGLRQNAVAQGELNVHLAQAALDEIRVELSEACRLAPQAAVELDHRREAEILRKQVGRLARAGQVTEAMLALAQAKALDPASPYLPGCEKAIQAGVQAQQVKELVRQIEEAKLFAQLDDIWARAEELGITHRVESIWKGRRARLQKTRERMLDWTTRYAVNLARYVIESDQTVMMHKERPGMVFVLDGAKTVVQLHQMQGRGCWKTVPVVRYKVNVVDLVALPM
jgi:multidrug efflux pump subunit AcrA (membrane-fusion protein)